MILAALNHLLAGAPWARKHLATFAARSARFDIPPLGISLEVTSDGYFAPASDATAPDVIIRLPANAPFKLVQGLDKVLSEATVEGNAEFATALSFVFRHLRWDVEEDLSKLIGDIAAHRLVLTATRCASWQQRALANLMANIAEFFVFEKQLLPHKDELMTLGAEIDRLNDELDHLESRLSSLAR